MSVYCPNYRGAVSFLRNRTSLTLHEILRLVWKQKVFYRSHNSRPLIFINSRFNLDHISTHCFFKIHISMSSKPLLELQNCIFSLGFPTKILYAFIIYRMRAACNVHLILLENMSYNDYSSHWQHTVTSVPTYVSIMYSITQIRFHLNVSIIIIKIICLDVRMFLNGDSY
jgi:hypothetical protein